MNNAEQTLYRTRLTADLDRQLDSIAGLLGAGGKVAAATRMRMETRTTVTGLLTL